MSGRSSASPRQDQPGRPVELDADETPVGEQRSADLIRLHDLPGIGDHGRPAHVVDDEQTAGREGVDRPVEPLPLAALCVGEDQVEGAQRVEQPEDVAEDELDEWRPLIGDHRGVPDGVDLDRDDRHILAPREALDDPRGAVPDPRPDLEYAAGGREAAGEQGKETADVGLARLHEAELPCAPLGAVHQRRDCHGADDAGMSAERRPSPAALGAEHATGCVFCAITAGTAEASVVHRDELVIAFMDIRPVTPGHLLVVPIEHAVGLADVARRAAARMFEVGRELALDVRRSGVRADGVNLFLADGEAAGQEVLHVHLHVIPRFEGDGLRVDAAAWRGRQPTRGDLDRIARAIVAAGLTIRAQLPEDAEALVDVHLRSWRWAYARLVPDAFLDLIESERAARVERLRAALMDPEPDERYWLAEAGGQVVGLASTRRSRDQGADERTAEVRAIYLAPEAAGRGIGRALLAHALADLRGRRFTRATLWTLDTNERARRFYEAAGWRDDDGRWTVEEREGTVLPLIRCAVVL